MAKFRVGMRVRILWSINWPFLGGSEGLILAPARVPGTEGTSEWVVAPDVWGTCDAPQRGLRGARFFSPNSSQLAPLHELGSWEALEEILGRDIRRIGEVVA
jgi:hypothetical protein